MFNFFKQREINIENLGTLEEGKTYMFRIVDNLSNFDLETIKERLGTALKKCKAFGIVYLGNVEVTPIKKQGGDNNETEASTIQ